MKILIDGSDKKILALQKQFPLVTGQLLTPLTQFCYFGQEYAIDNGAYTTFDSKRFERMLYRQLEHRSKCLFVCCPDIVGSARRTLEVFDRYACKLEGWPTALVAQDGQEDLPMPWDCIQAVFVGGTTHWKMSDHVVQLIKAAQILGKYVHIGRVNTIKRYRHFESLGCDSCDGSGLSRFSGMLEQIKDGMSDERPILEACRLDGRVGRDPTDGGGGAVA